MTPTTTTSATTARPKTNGRQPSEQAIDAAIDSATRVLRLPTFRDRYAEIADAAGREQLSYRAFLSELLLAECDDREERRATRRIHEAGFPRAKTLAEFDFAANTAINPATINTLAGCAWVSKGQSLCLIGDSGTGKSHLLIGLGTAAAQAGHKVRYVLAAKLVNELVEAADERQLSRTIARYGRVELLCIDELGYMELDKRGAELLFQVLTEREEKTAVAIASNNSLWLDQDLHRPTPLRRHRRPPHLRREHHRDRHQQLPTRPRPQPTTTRWGHFKPRGFQRSSQHVLLRGR